MKKIFCVAIAIIIFVSCKKEEQITEINQTNKSNILQQKSSLDYSKYEIYQKLDTITNDTIDCEILAQFNKELKSNSAVDKPLDLAIFQMESYFNIKYGLLVGIDGKFGGELKDFTSFEFQVPSFTRDNNIYVNGNSLVSAYKKVSMEIVSWLKSINCGLVLSDFSITDINNGYTTFKADVSGGVSSRLPITPKRIIKPEQQVIHPVHPIAAYPYATNRHWYIPFSNTGDYGFTVALNPNIEYQNIIEGLPTLTYINVQTPITNYRYDGSSSFLPYYKIVAGVNNMWNTGVNDNPTEALHFYKEWFTGSSCGINYQGRGDRALCAKVSSYFLPIQLPRTHNLLYIIGTPKYIKAYNIADFTD